MLKLISDIGPVLLISLKNQNTKKDSNLRENISRITIRKLIL